MTDEEKAKEWVRTNSGYSTKEFHGQKAIEAFLAGLEAGKDMAETDLATVAYMQGAESGYNKAFVEADKNLKAIVTDFNKANEWHYPSKGEYPKEFENVLCYCKVYDVKFYSTGHTVIGRDNKIRWWSSDRSEKLKVYAWKEITPPKEIKENEN